MSTYGTAYPKSIGTRSGKRRMGTKMKKYGFRTWLKNWLDKPNENESAKYVYSEDIAEDSSLQSDGMKFQLYKASGGYVIETRSYDRIRDRNNIKMYVITEDNNLGEEIGKIITMEALRS
jgi:hypothetical protein